MRPLLSALLCLGLCLGHRMRAQADELPRPSLRAENGSLGPRGKRVTFRCRGSQGAAEYLLEKELGRELKVLDSVQSEEAEVEFSIPRMTLNDTGNYSCRYRTASRWSERSDPLELVVTETNTENPEGQNWLFGLSKKHASILLGVSALLFLLILFLLLLFLLHHRARIRNGCRGTEIKKTPRSSDPDVSLMEQSLCE